MAKKQKFMKHIMTGISYMIPIVVAGGILGRWQRHLADGISEAPLQRAQHHFQT